jgi:hypothetical protein
MKINHSDDYNLMRRAAYPAIAEQVGALVKIEQARQLNQPAPPDALAVLDAVATVKAMHPKKRQDNG